jgi:hypothetical protein
MLGWLSSEPSRSWRKYLPITSFFVHDERSERRRERAIGEEEHAAQKHHGQFQGVRGVEGQPGHDHQQVEQQHAALILRSWRAACKKEFGQGHPFESPGNTTLAGTCSSVWRFLSFDIACIAGVLVERDAINRFFTKRRS